MHHTTMHLKDMGKDLCLALIVNGDLDSNSPTEEPQPLPEGVPQISQYSKNSILHELRSNKDLLKDNENDSSSGSESDPSEDNLDPEEVNTVYPVTLTPKPKVEEKKSAGNSNKKRAESNRSLTSQKERNKVVVKCKLCGEPEQPGHNCQKPKPKLRPIIKPQNAINLNTQPYYNAAGKKVRDQATQTVQATQNPFVKSVEEQKVSCPDSRNSSISPVKKENKTGYRANSSDEASSVAKVWKNEKAFPNLGRSSRQSPAWKHADAMKK